MGAIEGSKEGCASGWAICLLRCPSLAGPPPALCAPLRVGLPFPSPAPAGRNRFSLFQKRLDLAVCVSHRPAPRIWGEPTSSHTGAREHGLSAGPQGGERGGLGDQRQSRALVLESPDIGCLPFPPGTPLPIGISASSGPSFAPTQAETQAARPRGVPARSSVFGRALARLPWGCLFSEGLLRPQGQGLCPKHGFREGLLSSEPARSHSHPFLPPPHPVLIH